MDITKLLLPSDWMNIFIKTAITISFMYLCFKAIMIQFSDYSVNVPEFLFSFFKCLGYGILAYTIYLFYYEKPYIDAITLFTFILGIFECSHNFVLGFGDFIAALLNINKKLTISVIIIFVLVSPFISKSSSMSNRINNANKKHQQILFNIITKEQRQLNK